MGCMGEKSETDITELDCDLAEIAKEQNSEIKEFNGDLVIFKRDDGRSDSFYARIKIPNNKGKWKKYSLNTTDRQEALILGKEKYKELQILVKHNISTDTHKFRHAAKIALEEIEERIKDGAARPSDFDYQRLIPKFVEFFGDKHITSITPADIRKFYTKRASEVRKLRGVSDEGQFKLNRSTINNYAASLNRVFDVAVERNWLDSQQVPHLRNEGTETKRRPVFDEVEIEKLRVFFAKYARLTTKDTGIEGEKSKGGVKNRTLEIRRFLKGYADFIIETGVRPGTEMKNLKWCHFIPFVDGDNKFFKITLPTGKTGERTVVARLDVLQGVLKDHAQTFPDLQKMNFEDILRLDRFVFRLPDGSWPKDLPGAFERALVKAKLLMDTMGQKRSLYSLRHTYATQALLANASIHLVALNMGTSVYMIERHYSHLKVIQKALEVSAGSGRLLRTGEFGQKLTELLG